MSRQCEALLSFLLFVDVVVVVVVVLCLLAVPLDSSVSRRRSTATEPEQQLSRIKHERCSSVSSSFSC